MGKKLCCIISFLLLLSSVCFAKTVELSSLNYTFEIPAGYSTDSTYISSRHQYFAAHHPQDQIVLTVTSTPYTGKTFSAMSSTEIDQMRTAYANRFESYGISLILLGKYSSNGITFLKIEIQLPVGYQIQYATIRNNKMNGFTFTFKSTPTTAQKNEVLSVVKSIKNM